MDIKEESYFLDFFSENERECFIKDLVKKVKIDTKTELEEDSTCYSQCHMTGFNETTKESEIETKIDIKEEDWWLEKTSCSHDNIKDETHEDFCSTKPPSAYQKGISSYTSDLSCSQDLANHTIFDVRKDVPESGSGRKYQSQSSVVTDMSSLVTNVRSETSDGKVVSRASRVTQSTFLQQNNTNKQDFNKTNCGSILSQKFKNSYNHDATKKLSKYLSHLEKYRLTLDNKEESNCDASDKGVNHHSSVITHTLIDGGRQTHKCNICNNAFSKLSALKRRKLIHEGIKPHKCASSNKAFTQLSSLNSHKLIHEGIKPHKCTSSNKAFTQLSSLNSHKLSHEGIKPHKCGSCNKAFTQLSNLDSQKWIYEDIKPHKCASSNKAFTQL